MISKKIIKPKEKAFEFKKLKLTIPRERKSSFPIPRIKMSGDHGLISAQRLCAHFKIDGRKIILDKFTNNPNMFSKYSSLTEILSIINKLKYLAKMNNVTQINILVFSKEYSKIFTNLGFDAPSLNKLQAFNEKLKSLEIKEIDEIIDDHHFFVIDNKDKISVLENKELKKYIPYSILWI